MRDPQKRPDPSVIKLPAGMGEEPSGAMPMQRITPRGAVEACAVMGCRLPTESEWEFAAKESAGGAGAIAALMSGVSEWTSGRVAARNPSAPDDASSDLYVVLGGGLTPAAGGRAAKPTRLYMNASTQGRGVGFRCALGVETSGKCP